ncbi:MAG: hypothetical protein M1360_00880 [Candidatus Marsarchaeota archaeon]|jgi:hypothetical protein|nr:hypothetical protein [Candidatus Marsarchaeota archaeon]MCL5418480.1 hypothetical protein [Candidatus Marsarchaeota archaeon]
MVNTCAILGGTAYVNNWLSINLLVILVSLLIGALVLALSRIMPSRFSGKVTSAVRTELTQAFLSAIIIMILLGMASTACSISAAMSRTVTGSSLSPFQYADYYIGNLTTNTGIGLLSKIYFTSMQYSIESTILDVSFGQILNGYAPLSPSFGGGSLPISVSFGPKFELGKVFKVLADVYLSIFSMLLITVIGALYLQWLMLPLLEYTAFLVVLPVALVMRSLSFAGGNLRNTANAFLAIAIAAYMIYPLMVGFDGYAVSWIFSASNPSYKYLQFANTYTSYSTSTLFSSLPSGSLLSGNSATAPSYLESFLSSASINLNPLSELGSLVSSAATAPFTTSAIVWEMAKFLFIGIFMFAINIGVTAGLAMGMTKALNSGVEGASTFWGNL